MTQQDDAWNDSSFPISLRGVFESMNCSDRNLNEVRLLTADLNDAKLVCNYWCAYAAICDPSMKGKDRRNHIYKGLDNRISLYATEMQRRGIMMRPYYFGELSSKCPNKKKLTDGLL